MRSFSFTALTALSIVVIVSAAPPHSSPQKFTIKDAVSDESKNDNFLKRKLRQLECMRNVVGNVVGESDFKPLYEQYQRQIESIVKSDLMKCDGPEEMRSCFHNALGKIVNFYDGFFAKVAETNKLLSDDIQFALLEKCYTQQKFNFFVGDTTHVQAPPLRESYECQINALKEASIKNGMTNEWKKYEPKFKQHMDAWKRCESLVGIINKLWCNVKQAGYVFSLDVKYNMSLRKHPNYKKYEEDYKRIIKEKMCLGSGN